MKLQLRFPYLGPSRRSPRRVVECRFEPGSGAPPLDPKALRRLKNILVDAFILKPSERFPAQELPDSPERRFASLLAQIALLLQQKSGHAVAFSDCFHDDILASMVVLVEHEHSEVGDQAVALGIELIKGRLSEPAGKLRQFMAFARELALPAETLGLIRAARRRGIPVCQPERSPLFEHGDPARRIRINGLLRIGHGPDLCVLDGCFPLGGLREDRISLVKSPARRRALVEKAGGTCIPRPGDDVPGGRLCLLVVNTRVFAYQLCAGKPPLPAGDAPPEFIDLAQTLHGVAGGVPVSLRILLADPAAGVRGTGGGIYGFDIAPDLSEFAAIPGELDAICDEVLRGLFPQERRGKIPLFAITGTNGKTSTTRMIAHLYSAAGQVASMTTTDGIYVGAEHVHKDDSASLMSHLLLLSDPRVEVAVLEHHHRSIESWGFAFDQCDVGICLNVTHEHIKQDGIRTVAEMASIKQAVPAMAARAAILFADNEHCRRMIPHMTSAVLGLVSLQSGVQELELLAGNRPACFCTLEPVEGSEWIVIHDKHGRTPLVEVSKLPVGFGGTARFMVSNAMHAGLAAVCAGLDPAAVGTALQSFLPGPDTTPGRLNEYTGFPFRVIVDYAHNQDGHARLADFAAAQPVSGQRVLGFSVDARRDEEHLRRCVQSVAGRYDRYVCKEYFGTPLFRSNARKVRDELLRQGVGSEQVTVKGKGPEAIHAVLDTCNPGDLLILVTGTTERPMMPAIIEDYLRKEKDG